MSQTDLQNTLEQPESGILFSPKRAHLLIVWALCLPLLVLLMGSASASRTQEARVLETAREMAEGISPWLVPHCSGELRLQKPPLAYWMAAGAFKVGGVNEWAGRAPGVLVTWLTIGLCGYIGATLFGRRAGLLTLALMTATYGAFRYGRLAETDSLAMLGVTLAVWGFWRASDTDDRRRVLLWNWAAGLGLAIAVMGKGPPAMFPLLFLAAWCAVNRTARPLWNFCRSGGVVIFAVLGFWWWAYIWMTVTLDAVGSELNVVLTGSNHPGPIYWYLYSILIIAAPWSALLISGLLESALQVTRDRRLRGLWVWFACCLVPLSLAGNKQMHYGMALLPVCALLAAWVLDLALSADAPKRVKTWIPWLVRITAGVSVLVAAAMPVARVVQGQPIGPWDYALSAAGAITFATGLVLLMRRRTLIAGVLVYSLGIGIVFSAVFGPWGRSLAGREPGDIAAEIQAEYGNGPYMMFDSIPDLPLVFAMQTVAEASLDPAEIDQWMERNPKGVVLLVGDEDPADDGLPEWLVPEQKFGAGKNTVWKLARK